MAARKVRYQASFRPSSTIHCGCVSATRRWHGEHDLQPVRAPVVNTDSFSVGTACIRRAVSLIRNVATRGVGVVFPTVLGNPGSQTNGDPALMNRLPLGMQALLIVSGIQLSHGLAHAHQPWKAPCF